jgi:hypothetical protein
VRLLSGKKVVDRGSAEFMGSDRDRRALTKRFAKMGRSRLKFSSNVDRLRQVMDIEDFNGLNVAFGQRRATFLKGRS